MDNQNFNSIEKLLEFGMSMAIAQQMMQTMNNAMQNMVTPQFSNVNVPLPQRKLFYALVNNIPQGPFTEQEIMSHILDSRITNETFVWHNGMSGWMPSKHVPEVSKLFNIMPPPIR